MFRCRPRHRFRTPFHFWLWLLCAQASLALAAEKAPRAEFTRMVAHWSDYGGPEYFEFIDAAKPELVQFGFHGAHFYSLAHTDQYADYPAHFPVKGLAECGQWFTEQNRELKKRGILVVGHFNVEFLVGEPDGPDGPRGFFKWYRDLWDEKTLGPKPPVEDPVDFLEKGADGQPLVANSYAIGGMREYTACLRNPHWQAVLKAWVKAGIDRGVDGFIANYFYRKDCRCEHCQRSFRDHLRRAHAPADLKSRFAIENLDTHVFAELVCWHKPEESTPLRREMLRWSQLSNKDVFDAVFHEHGRSLKPDLLTAQWNHLSDFSAIDGDERCLLPASAWGRDESYLWYSMGASGVHTDLKKGVLADGTLQARYIRGAFDDKPFTLGKYEHVRIRAAIAELAANGGAPMGFYARTKEPEAREIFATYYGFLERYRELYHANRPHAEAVLKFPRRAIHEGDLKPLEAFRHKGRELLDTQVLFDVLPDDLPDLETVAASRGRLVDPEDAREVATGSRIAAPPTVRSSATIPARGGEIDLHFVNYDREELPPHANGQPNPGKGAMDEKPIPVAGISVAFQVPQGLDVTAVEFITPETPEPRPLETAMVEGRVTFTVPGFLVYGVVRMKTRPANLAQAPRVAGITTEYRHNSHADMLLGRLVETDSLDGGGGQPALNLTSVFVDQFPESDTSRALASAGRFKIAGTIDEAVTGGGSKLAVDGVMVVAEHGDYPESDTGQFIFPKRRFFTELFAAFDRTGQVVPVFNDKHLADTWIDSQWIHDECVKRGIPLMAGSSLPGLWRFPATNVPRNARVKEIVGVSYHRLDAYGFHAMEMVQCLAERRAGGESGIRRVQTVTGDAVWTSDLYNHELLEAALARQSSQAYLRRQPLPRIVKEPVLFVMDHNDGLRVSVLTLNGAVAEWSAAWELEDGTRDATLFWTQEARPFFHFALQMDGIEAMIRTGKPAWPVERTLLTSGALDALLIAKRDGVRGWVETLPLAKVRYQSDWDWRQPPPPPHGRDIRSK